MANEMLEYFKARRATISVASNIAEGSSRSSGKERSHFYRMAYASLMELHYQLIIAIDLEVRKLKSLISSSLKCALK